MRRHFLVYLITFSTFSAMFFGLFQLPLRNFQPVLFYRGLNFLSFTFLVLLLVELILYRNNYFRDLTQSIISSLLISTCLHLTLFVVLPVTFDRSITTFLLTTLNQRNSNSCQGLTKSELEGKLINTYILQENALDKRLAEQKEIDFVSQNKQCVSLTPKAENFLTLVAVIQKIYALKN